MTNNKTICVLNVLVLVTLVSCLGSESTGIPGKLDECGRNSAACSDGPQFAISKLAPTAPDGDGFVEGFDIDQVISNGEEKQDCRVEDYTSPSGIPGIDNRMTDLLDQTTEQIKNYVPSVLQSTIGTGGFLFILELVGVDDFENDDDVAIVIRRSTDIPILGTDNTILDGQTFSLANDHFSGFSDNAVIENGRLKAGPFSWKLLTRFFAVDIRFTFQNFYLDLEISDDRKSLSGVVGGSVPIDDILGIADAIDEFGGDSSVAVIRTIIPPLADVMSADTEDCDQLSFAFSAEAKISFLFDDINTANTLEPLTGDQIFVNFGCSSCHAVDHIPGAEATIGPRLDGLGQRADDVIGQQKGKAYIRQSMTNPDGVIVSGFEEGIMPSDTITKLTLDQFDTLIDWLSEL